MVAAAWSPIAGVAFAAWSAATLVMLRWHVGLLETLDGRVLDGIGPANAVTLGRSAIVPLLPFLSPPELALALALAVLSDAIDGPLARRRGERTRLGTWLDPSVDTFLLASALVAAARLELLPPLLIVVGLVRALLPWPILLVTAFARASVPPLVRARFGRSAGFAMTGGVALAGLGVAEAKAIVAGGLLVGVAGLAERPSSKGRWSTVSNAATRKPPFAAPS